MACEAMKYINYSVFELRIHYSELNSVYFEVYVLQ